MPNYYLSVLYKHIIQVENKNVGLKVGGHKHTIAPPVKKVGGAHAPLAPPLPTPVIYIYITSPMVKDHGDSERGNHYIGYSFRLATRYIIYAPSH